MMFPPQGIPEVPASDLLRPRSQRTTGDWARPERKVRIGAWREQEGSGGNPVLLFASSQPVYQAEAVLTYRSPAS